jgi:hypothetical protein
LAIDGSVYRPEDFTVENETVHYHSRGLHKHAIEINRRFERLWRRNHELKKLIRSLYVRLNSNAAAKRSLVSTSALKDARTIYEDANRKLHDFLRDLDYSDLPDWVTRGS